MLPKMSTIFFVFVFFLTICQFSSCREKYTKITSKPNNIVFKFPEEATSERKLEECAQHQACNIVHERFWLPRLVERICRCPDGFECPWSKASKNYSMMLNNRSVIKFCESPKDMKTCSRKETAAVVHGRIKEDHSEIMPRRIQVSCKCPRSHYWWLQKYTFDDDGSVAQSFRCQKQTMCDRNEFCGYVRADIFSVYYRCACPERHLCITKDRKRENVNEFLYSGPAYKAYCVPWD
ncbi:U-scoloptoxin(11)-Ssd3a-like [Venturia canescens]|uniref:U-scoloptoxin(11)-Ssd3a-like n=1 Tax=Venturia canescens TaxID=32260 RepID=UPI001C9D176B|nr:U-scoloptoxin(11)-Ssd3a-like [Venturia canescens]XP_043274184.1 U-scoloptoxin(11)-Ssd3a-like [Venturia canescens]